MSSVLRVPELTLTVASYLSSPADISSLSRCNKILHSITIPYLYRDIEFSVFKVSSLVNTLKSDGTLSRHCRSLSVTLNGNPLDEEHAAYIISSPHSNLTTLRERILSGVEFVIYECSVHGKLTGFSWHLVTTDRYYHYWLTVAARGWKNLAMSGGALQKLQFIEQGGRNVRSVIPFDNHLETLAQQTFLSVSSLVLRITINSSQFKILRQMISSFPGIKVLVLDIYCRNRIDVFPPNKIDGILPDIAFRHLESLTLHANTYSVANCLDTFISKQPSLNELSVIHMTSVVRERFFATKDDIRLRALHMNSRPFRTVPPQANQLAKLSIMRISLSNSKITNFVNGLAQLKCLEVCHALYASRELVDGQPDHDSSKYTRQIENDIIEVGVLNNIYGSFDVHLQSICTSFKRLEAALSAWAAVTTVRALRISYILESYGGQCAEIPGPLDEYTLDAAKIPLPLEYILWEVPWTKKLYRIERGLDGFSKMIFTGLDRLPGRRRSPTLTWTNESVFDHMDIGDQSSIGNA